MWTRREVARALAGALTTQGISMTLGMADRIDPIGAQIYTVRDLFAKNPEATLAALKRIGFAEVEFAGYYPSQSAAEVKAMLDRVGLKAPSGHVGLDEMRGRWATTLELAAGIGHRYIVLAWTAPEERARLEQYRAIAGFLNTAGESARTAGIQLCYHNHDFEFTAIDGVTPYDLLLKETDPSLVQLELDLYWIAKAGRDPLHYFAAYPGRFPMVHVKDMDAKTRGFTELGRGTIDFARSFRERARAGIKHFFYEQDETAGDPIESARVSFGYLRGLRV